MTTPPPSLKPEALASLVERLRRVKGAPLTPWARDAIEQAATTIETLEADVAALRDALEGYARNYLLDEYENPDLCYDGAHRAAVSKLFTTLERTAR